MKPAALIMFFALALHAANIGKFDQSSDIGRVLKPGSVEVNGEKYRVTGSGFNMWAKEDAFRIVSSKLSGDVLVEARLNWITEGGNPHKKAGVILRAGLDADAVYADLLQHYDGSVSFQWRKERGGVTAETRAALKAPVRLRLLRHGDVVSAEVAPLKGSWQPVGAMSVPLGEEVHAGIFVCAHDENRSETAEFSDVRLEATPTPAQRVIESTLETIDIETRERKVVFRARMHFEAPNWTRDGRTLVVNSRGKIAHIPASGGEPRIIDTGDVEVNNDHGLSPDGKTMVISARTGKGPSLIYTVPAEGGKLKQITPTGPSYWHGWSPDGKTLAFCGSRNNEFDIYTVPVEGGEEKRLTTATGLDDGPDYSPDGRYIYFNSERSGLMRIWRMKADGSDQEMVSRGPESADWFAHPSPDGKWIVYLSFDKSVKGHPPNKDVTLKIAPAEGGDPKLLTILFGGQGTINVPSWSPDSKKVAFVSYRLVAP